MKDENFTQISLSDDRKKEIGDLLTDVPAIRQLYTQLVPVEVSPRDFWHRYYYKIHLLELDEARRQAFFRRSFETEGKLSTVDDEDALTKEFTAAWAGKDLHLIK